MPTLLVRIPDDRVGALIGPGGVTKRTIEERTRTSVAVDTEDGSVTVTGPDDRPDDVLRGRDIVLAIGRGFSPDRAFRLLKDDTYLGVVEIRRVTGRREKAALWRIRSRLIGEHGRARTRIEELSGSSMSVYGGTVALIGKERELERATRAVELLLRGSEHSVVFHMLARQRADDALSDATSSDVPADGGE
jgi:ribosomal RNA assembly protein